MASLADERAADVIEELAAEDQVDVIEDLPPEKAADILEEMEPDEAADLVGDLSTERQAELLSLMEDEEADEVRGLLAYGEETAGGLMTTELFIIGLDETAGSVIARLRDVAPAADQVYYLYVTDAEGVLVGTVTLRGLIVAAESTPIHEIMRPDPISVETDTDAEDVARAIARYNLLALPVVDAGGHLVGAVTVDDAFERALGEGWRKRLPELFEPAEER
jgi:Mg/Co/Ni transporter MgtE